MRSFGDALSIKKYHVLGIVDVCRRRGISWAHSGWLCIDADAANQRDKNYGQSMHSLGLSHVLSERKKVPSNGLAILS